MHELLPEIVPCPAATGNEVSTLVTNWNCEGQQAAEVSSPDYYTGNQVGNALTALHWSKVSKRNVPSRSRPN